MKSKRETKEKEEYCILSTSYQFIPFALLPMPTRWQDVIIVRHRHRSKSKEEKEEKKMVKKRFFSRRDWRLEIYQQNSKLIWDLRDEEKWKFEGDFLVIFLSDLLLFFLRFLQVFLSLLDDMERQSGKRCSLSFFDSFFFLFLIFSPGFSLTIWSRILEKKEEEKKKSPRGRKKMLKEKKHRKKRSSS